MNKRWIIIVALISMCSIGACSKQAEQPTQAEAPAEEPQEPELFAHLDDEIDEIPAVVEEPVDDPIQLTPPMQLVEPAPPIQLTPPLTVEEPAPVEEPVVDEEPAIVKEPIVDEEPAVVEVIVFVIVVVSVSRPRSERDSPGVVIT